VLNLIKTAVHPKKDELDLSFLNFICWCQIFNHWYFTAYNAT